MQQTITSHHASWRTKRDWKCKPLFLSFALFFALAGMSQAADQNSSSPQSRPLSSADRGRMIYVSDFTLDPSAFKQGRQDEAKKLVKLMSNTLVTELTKAGLRAHYLSADESGPVGGLVLSGSFIELDEGSHVRRALVGFGSGAAKVEVHATLADAAQPEDALYELAAQKNSGKKPGAVIIPSPIAAGVKLAMTKNSPEKTVKKIAQQIAAELNKQLAPEILVAEK